MSWAAPWSRRDLGCTPAPASAFQINTVTALGDTLKAAQAMAARLKAGGFADADVQVLSPAPRKGNLVARLRGTGPSGR